MENIAPLAYRAIVAAVTELILTGRVKQTRNERKTCQMEPEGNSMLVSQAEDIYNQVSRQPSTPS